MPSDASLSSWDGLSYLYDLFLEAQPPVKIIFLNFQNQLGATNQIGEIYSQVKKYVCPSVLSSVMLVYIRFSVHHSYIKVTRCPLSSDMCVTAGLIWFSSKVKPFYRSLEGFSKKIATNKNNLLYIFFYFLLLLVKSRYLSNLSRL